MTKPSYPPITEASLTPFRAIEIQLKARPDLLDLPECPYPPFIKAMLRRLVGGEAVDTGTAAQALIDAGEDALDLEIAKLFITVKTDAAAYTGSDTKDKMALMRTSNDLLTKIVDLQAKRHNIRNMARMQRSVIEAMEEFMTPAQRTEFLTKLEASENVL